MGGILSSLFFLVGCLASSSSKPFLMAFWEDLFLLFFSLDSLSALSSSSSSSTGSPSSSSSISSSILSSFSGESLSYMARARWFSSMIFFCCCETECREAINFSWSCRLISNSMFWSSKIWFLMMIYRKSLFSFVLILLFISYLIFLVFSKLYCNCRLVISFFSKFFLEFSFSVYTNLDRDLISYCACEKSSLSYGTSLNCEISFIFLRISA